MSLLGTSVPLVCAAAMFGVVAVASCGSDRACFAWSAARGACPSREEAYTTFTSRCHRVEHVDSDGELTSDGLCCYDVTNTSNNYDDCVPTSPATTVATTGGSIAASSSSGMTCDGTGNTCSGCVACAEVGNCADEKLTCDANPSCATLRKCVESCAQGDQSCVDACIAGHQQGVGDLNALYTCLFCQECYSVCDGSMLNCPK